MSLLARRCITQNRGEFPSSDMFSRVIETYLCSANEQSQIGRKISRDLVSGEVSSPIHVSKVQ